MLKCVEEATHASFVLPLLGPSAGGSELRRPDLSSVGLGRTCSVLRVLSEPGPSDFKATDAAP